MAVVLAYLLGSIPFAYIVTRWRTGLDIRYVGEGNVGGRNVFHVVGPRWGIVVAILDVGKGYVAYLISQGLGAPLWAVLVGGFAVAAGHGFPLFLRGRGGKGVSVSAGYLLGLAPVSTLAGGAVLGLAHYFLRDFNRSVGIGIGAIILSPPLFGYSPWLIPYALVLFLLLGVKKAIDRPHERRVWAEAPWQGDARPGFHKEMNGTQLGDSSGSTSPIQPQR